MDFDQFENFFCRIQKRNPLGICAFLPIDSRKIEILNGLELKLRYRDQPLDLPHFFKTSCLYCVSMFLKGVYLEYIPHFSERHTEIEINENAYFYKKYYQQMIKNLIVPFLPSAKKSECESDKIIIENNIIKNDVDELMEEIRSSFSNNTLSSQPLFQKDMVEEKSIEDLEFDEFLFQFSKEDSSENNYEELSKENHLKIINEELLKEEPLENNYEENSKNENNNNKIVLYKKNNQFSYPSVLPSAEKKKTEKENRLKKKEELIIQLIQKNFTTKKFITKKIYVRENNSIYIFYFIITCAVIFTSIYR